MASGGHGGRAHIAALRERIEESLVTSISERLFLPIDKVDEIFSLPAIKDAVKELSCQPDDLIGLSQKIHLDGKVVFAMLIDMGQEDLIINFRRHDALDNEFPLDIERAKEILGASVGASVARRLVSEVQWKFLPFVFPERMWECRVRIADRMILPFVSCKQIGAGAYGDVEKIRVYPYQQNFVDKEASEVYLVRKRLRAKSCEAEFQREEQCLRLLNGIRHPNIVPFWGSYIHKEEFHFLFPYIETNLSKFLLCEHRHGQFRWDFTFYTALTGLTSALSKTHRLALEEEKHGIQLQAIGYHHDIRPPNVLVDQNSFILADFGLGRLKGAEALSHTQYKSNNGDYIAPECTDIEEVPQTVNRAIDVWALGCLIMEVVTYMLKGSEGVNSFRKKRITAARFGRWKDSVFYEPQADGGIKQEVLAWVDELKCECTTTRTDAYLLNLSLEALHADINKRPTMDRIYQRLASASMLKHFDSVQDVFQRLRGEPHGVSPASHEKHHLKCLRLAQEQFTVWGHVLSLSEIDIFKHQSVVPERTMEGMASLFHILCQEPNHRVSGDPTSLRSFQDNMDRSMMKLWELLPSHLSDLANDRIRQKCPDYAPHKQIVNTVPDKVPSGSTVASCDALLREFEVLSQSFEGKLPNLLSLDELRKSKSIEDVYDITDDLQRCQELRNLQRMEPALQRLRSYAEMMGSTISGSDQYSAMVWGPLGFLLRRSSLFDKAYTSVIDAIVKLGDALPDFRAPESFLRTSPQSKEILVLLFKDILNFYGVILRPFSHPGWMSKFRSLWPRVWALISEISTHISRLTLLMRQEISVEHIHQEYEFRKNALEAFSKQARDSRQQECNRIKTSLRPREYHESLYELRGVRSQGTGNWLLSNKVYTDWLDDSQDKSRVLWLRGIPGSGKSVLCGTIVDYLRGNQKLTCYAFLSYKYEKISALSMIHSVIFQLVEGNDELVDLVCQSNVEDLKSNLDSATELLKCMVIHAGSVRLIIDGVDEISEAERMRIIGQLLELVKSRIGLEVILSSRPEADLVHALGNAAVAIHVHDHNEENIESYVTDYTEKMFFDRQIHRVDHKRRIRALLAPVPKRAKGMFLYARLIMNMVEDITDMAEIHNELTVLPETLDDAYHRIILRLDKHKTKMQSDKAKRLLGWIACSSVPLTVEEAEQALAVQPGYPQQIYDSFAKLNPVKLLGPIVETAGGYIRFVHFTAKEYVSSAHLRVSLIDANLATLDLARRCIEYLCQHHHDPSLSSQEFSKNLLTGQYILDNFASRMWFELSYRYLCSIDGSNPPIDLVKLLHRLWQCRNTEDLQEGDNSAMDEVDHSSIQYSDDNEFDGDRALEWLMQQHSLLYHLLRRVFRFRQSSFLYTGEEIQDGTDDEQDPLSTLATSSRIHQIMDEELCDSPGVNCQSKDQESHHKCVKILNDYGERPFKCKYPRCEFWRHGFATRTRREHHEFAHETPLKCYFAGCKFGRVGFLSERMRERHLQEAHSSDPQPVAFDVENLGNDSVVPLLHYLVAEDQVEHVETILSNLRYPDEYKTKDLRLLASLVASSAMLRLLFNKSSEDDRVHRVQCAIQSIKGRNQSTMEANLMALPRPIQFLPFTLGQGFDSQNILWQLVSTNWVEGMKIWSRSVKQQVETDPGVFDAATKQGNMESLLGNLSLLKEAAKHPFGEQTLNIFWNDTGLLSYLDNRSAWATRTLKNVAKFGCSVTLAADLLGMGANINFQRGEKDRSGLHVAAAHDSAAGAKMMEFLLFRGADPNATTYVFSGRNKGSTRTVRDEKGAQNIQKWLGKCWDDLVEETKHIRIEK